ncbi:hypothetical protein HR11_08540 [Porphyromonas macacae]|uniref:lipopolysaccharide biosynthesis protein n=1 Tax=Porphyromonas macacae TaxID=28115 RepID=UPI00052BEAD4|nr:lipopolysaccharide biosynthesis protein [Porphyromonas macacae]KGN98570.1 hypothetical protein HR11_08540 [Porphyromonas macacae]
MVSSILKSFFWSAFDKFGAVFITFLLNLVLARFFLSPKDFGLIGMIYIFIALANTTVIGGFGQTIIQRKELSQKDYNTTFTFNIAAAFILYIILFFCAPLIANFYAEPQLLNIIRILSLVLVINGFFIVHNSLLIREMRFKLLSLINNFSLIVSATISVFLAYKGLGVWCLVFNTLFASLLQTIFLWVFTEAKVQLQFSKDSFKSLFSFGGFMYISTVVETLYANALYMILGKGFSPQLLGYYTQAEKLQGVPVNTIGTVINQVTFPKFSKMQSSLKEVATLYKRSITSISLLTTMLMGLLFVIAPYLIVLLFTNKWEPSIYIFQLLCIAGAFTPLNAATTNVIKSLGKARLFFNVQLWKRVIALIFLIMMSTLGISPLLYTVCIINIVFYMINVFAVSRLVEISFWDILLTPIKLGIPSIISAILTSFILSTVGKEMFSSLIVGCITFISFDFLFFEIIKNKDYFYLKNNIVNFIKQK